MDLTAEFYLQTIDTVFVRQTLPKGKMMHRGRPVDLGEIRSVPLMTIEGEKDDITGVGQCRAALELCGSIPEALKLHYECAGVGHYGIFNGSRFRVDIAPRIAQFVRVHDRRAAFIPTVPARDRIWAGSRAADHSHEVSCGTATFRSCERSAIHARRRCVIHHASIHPYRGPQAALPLITARQIRCDTKDWPRAEACEIALPRRPRAKGRAGPSGEDQPRRSAVQPRLGCGHGTASARQASLSIGEGSSLPRQRAPALLSYKCLPLVQARAPDQILLSQNSSCRILARTECLMASAGR